MLCYTLYTNLSPLCSSHFSNKDAAPLVISWVSVSRPINGQEVSKIPITFRLCHINCMFFKRVHPFLKISPSNEGEKDRSFQCTLLILCFLHMPANQKHRFLFYPSMSYFSQSSLTFRLFGREVYILLLENILSVLLALPHDMVLGKYRNLANTLSSQCLVFK